MSFMGIKKKENRKKNLNDEKGALCFFNRVSYLNTMFANEKEEEARKDFIGQLHFINELKKINVGLGGSPKMEEMINEVVQLNVNVYRFFNNNPKWKKLYSECNELCGADYFLKRVNVNQMQVIDNEELFFNISFDLKQKKLQHSENSSKHPRSLFSLAFNNIAERFNPNSEYFRWWVLSLESHEKLYKFGGDLMKEYIFLSRLGIRRCDIKISESVYEQRTLAGELWAFHKSWCDKCVYPEKDCTLLHYRNEYYFPFIKYDCPYRNTKLFRRGEEILSEWENELRALEWQEIEELEFFRKEWIEKYGKFFLGESGIKFGREILSGKLDMSKHAYYPYYSFACFANRRHMEYIGKVNSIKQWAFSSARELISLEKKEIRERENNGLSIAREEEFIKLKGDYYSSLNLSREANENEIKAICLAKLTSWRLELERKDLYCGLNEEIIEEGIEKVTRICTVIGNSKWRKLYNYWLFGLKSDHALFDEKIEKLREKFNLSLESDELFSRMCKWVGWVCVNDEVLTDEKGKYTEIIDAWGNIVKMRIKERETVIFHPPSNNPPSNNDLILSAGLIFIVVSLFYNVGIKLLQIFF